MATKLPRESAVLLAHKRARSTQSHTECEEQVMVLDPVINAVAKPPASSPPALRVAMGAAGRGGNSMLGTDCERRCYYLISHRSHWRLREVK